MPIRLNPIAPNFAEVRQAEENEQHLIERARQALTCADWIVGECASKWTHRFSRGRTDRDFAELVGGVDAQFVRQRRSVWEKFSNIYSKFSNLSWSHFNIVLGWDNPETWLQWASENYASVAKMKNHRREELEKNAAPPAPLPPEQPYTPVPDPTPTPPITPPRFALPEVLPFPSNTPEPEPEPVPEPRSEQRKKYITLRDYSDGDEALKHRVLNPTGIDDHHNTFNDQEDSKGIEWALWSWNPVTGCRHDCPYCYARDIANRFYEQKFEPSLHPSRLLAPRYTRFPTAKAAEWVGHKNVFVCSMADLFGRWVPKEWIDAVLRECANAPQWNFLFLTKFPNRMSEFEFSDNCWVGTTVDQQARVKNAEKSFRKVKAKVKWLSCEPLIEPLKFSDLGAFQWLVIGGASSSNKTPEWNPPVDWILDLMVAAKAVGTRVYLKPNCRIRQYPGVTEPDSAPSQLVYLPQEIG